MAKSVDTCDAEIGATVLRDVAQFGSGRGRLRRARHGRDSPCRRGSAKRYTLCSLPPSAGPRLPLTIDPRGVHFQNRREITIWPVAPRNEDLAVAMTTSL